ncbi:uncharacterized protein LOC105425832 isoform X1 [Pogonomyrmex barbatus]|uniref:Uncharacterized protein LOC105425832 isoform X1 n=1 Tax=Pogonomyrmex barbatus TaxID=144034 RepID=A0A6I9WT29_9HYME|nr:uncharacterized protein LOC105425832 isoform X1 [Pogonomyrmex barbatus]XP_011635089.1 uncharacterized protein LOC105425832 isoform X1 [Pogonomyrmex barbatus]XP_011635097.1 uncharacterized protein LOC105425832 isoform X1 [Pogonomyrmex barbatus]XP_011635105.1 uncharacterized protein LOC105425832 isoform X1 [Pogonomyrmex barbatus]XP_011635116.1 uncharacterized protein LOC105425832 isoform X1 [Pogonomyrmex barbatus]
MANIGRIVPIRIEKRTLQHVSIPNRSSLSSLEEDYGSTESEDMSTSPDTSCRSSADADKNFNLDEDFREKLTENIIEKMENLRLRRNDDEDEDNEDANENFDRTRCINNENVDNVEYRDSCKSQTGCHTDNEDINNNENNVTADDNEGCLPLNICDEPEDKKRLYDENSLDDESENEQVEKQESEDSDDSDLIERGPIKPDFQPFRRQPYTMNWLSHFNDAADAAMDYDKTAKQILKNKDYSEKLNPCLDQLSNRNQIFEANSIMDSNWIAENGDIHSEISSNNTAALPFIVVNDNEQYLMNMMPQFQPAIISDASSHSSPSPGTKTWSDSPASSFNVVSRSNSRTSSRAQSTESATNLESPRMHGNVISSPLGSPQVASTYRMQQVMSSSSSSNQSYNDVPSPSNYHTPLNYQIVEQLVKSLSEDPCSSETIVNSSDATDEFSNSSKLCHQLFHSVPLMDQMLEENGQIEGHEALKESQITSIPPYLPFYNEQSVQTLGSDLNSVSREYSASTMRNEKPEACLGISNADPIQVGNLPINGELLSVYANKGSNGGCTYVNRAVNGYATAMEPKYYESIPKNGQVNIVPHNGNTLLEIGLSNETSVKTSEQNLPASQEKYPMFHAIDEDKTYNQLQSTFVFSDYQIPTMVSSFVPNPPPRNLKRDISPWPILRLPNVEASERLKKKLNDDDVRRAMSNLLKKSVEELAAADEDGDTLLMCLVGNPQELRKKMAYLIPLVEKLGTMEGALTKMNKHKVNALYLAAMNCPEMPYVTGYLGAAMLKKGININQTYHKSGDTLMHSVTARGDTHAEVLAELLALKTIQGNSAFNLFQRNHEGKTALHIAVESHARRGVRSLATTRLLLENGADIKVHENKCGDTALHMAASLSCDPALVKVLLSKATPNVVNEINYMHNTPLHMAAAVSNTISLEKQEEVCRLLIQAGGQTDKRNLEGKTPLALVSSERKEAIKKIFRRR